LTNIVRHSGAQRAEVLLEASPAHLRLRVRDDGKGFDVPAARRRAAAGGSLGLIGMEERAALAGGALRILSSPGTGTEVRVLFALEATHPGDQNKTS
jgi:two-component system sensor histidine kinase UhpB